MSYTLQSIPPELHLSIFECLAPFPASFFALTRTSKYWHQLYKGNKARFLPIIATATLGRELFHVVRIYDLLEKQPHAISSDEHGTASSSNTAMPGTLARGFQFHSPLPSAEFRTLLNNDEDAHRSLDPLDNENREEWFARNPAPMNADRRVWPATLRDLLNWARRMSVERLESLLRVYERFLRVAKWVLPKDLSIPVIGVEQQESESEPQYTQSSDAKNLEEREKRDLWINFFSIEPSAVVATSQQIQQLQASKLLPPRVESSSRERNFRKHLHIFFMPVLICCALHRHYPLPPSMHIHVPAGYWAKRHAGGPPPGDILNFSLRRHNVLGGTPEMHGRKREGVRAFLTAAIMKKIRELNLKEEVESKDLLESIMHSIALYPQQRFPIIQPGQQQAAARQVSMSSNVSGNISNLYPTLDCWGVQRVAKALFSAFDVDETLKIIDGGEDGEKILRAKVELLKEKWKEEEQRIKTYTDMLESMRAANERRIQSNRESDSNS